MIPASAFILIGGENRRFGSPKWQAVLNGKTVLDRILSACAELEHRFVVGKEKPADVNIPFIQDSMDLQAPIIGLWSALKHCETDWNLILSCDLPLINHNAIETLWNSWNEKADAIIPIANEQEHGTCGFYSNRILPEVESAIQKNNYSLKSLINQLNSVRVDFGDDERFWNMNTKKDFEKIESKLADNNRML